MDPQRLQRSQKSRPTGESSATPEGRKPSVQAPQVSDLHQEASLRDTVADLIDSGDLNTTSDGTVREGRIAEARRNTEHGAYNDYRVLADVVDRLLNQWNI